MFNNQNLKVMKANIYQVITDKIIEQLEKGVIPWRKPWTGGFMGCISHSNGRPYSLINQMLLGNIAGEWLTFGQIQAEGGHIKKGEKSSMVVFWSFMEKVENEAVCDDKGDQIGTKQVVVARYPVLRNYSVWHISQVEGIKPKYDVEKMRENNQPLAEGEKIIAEYIAREDGLKLNVCNSDKAFYSPSRDVIQVPEREQYPEVEEYYSTTFHEMVHSTGHKNRLNRDTLTANSFFGDATYAKEELVAEIGSAFLCHKAGIDTKRAFKNSASYIQSWLNALKNDNRMIVLAASKAEKATEYILTGKK